MHESVALIIEKQSVSFLLHIFGSALSLNLCSSLVCLVVRLKVAVCFHKFCVFSFLLRFGRRLHEKASDGRRLGRLPSGGTRKAPAGSETVRRWPNEARNRKTTKTGGN